eukprot:3683656-Rhodomonas_salina.1
MVVLGCKRRRSHLPKRHHSPAEPCSCTSAALRLVLTYVVVVAPGEGGSGSRKQAEGPGLTEYRLTLLPFTLRTLTCLGQTGGRRCPPSLQTCTAQRVGAPLSRAAMRYPRLIWRGVVCAGMGGFYKGFQYSAMQSATGSCPRACYAQSATDTGV